MTNEEIALEIQSGERYLWPVLWEQTERILRKLSYRYMQQYYLPVGFDFEDCLQCGYIALVRAVESYNPEKEYKLSSYLWNHLRNVIREETGLRYGEKMFLCSYHVTIDEDSETELLDILADESAAEDFEKVELTDARRLVTEAVERLPGEQARAIKLIYYCECSRREAAERLRITQKQIDSLWRKALCNLRKDRRLKSLYREYIRHYTERELPISFYSSKAFLQASDAIERQRQSGQYLSYGKEQSLLYAARRSFMEDLKEQKNLM